MPSAPLVVAADLGATLFRVALDDGGPEPQIKIQRTADLPRHGSAGIATAVASALAAVAPGGAGLAVAGVSVAAAVTPDGRVLVERPFGLPAGPGLRDAVRAALRVPVAVANDADCAVLAEIRFGAARGCRNVVLIALGTNIGTGLVVDGRLIRGGRGAAGEGGLLLVPARTTGPSAAPGGPRPVVAPGFGRGRTAGPEGYAWLEDLVGGGALARAAGTPRSVAAAHRGSQRAARAIARTVEGLAVLVADLVAILDPDLVVLSGAIPDEDQTLVDRVRERVRALAPGAAEVVAGALGPRAALLGAAILARGLLAPEPAVPESASA